MPIKLKPSQKIKDRSTGNVVTQHYYLKCMTLIQLEEVIEAPYTRAKIKDKCRKEIVKRYVKI